MARSTPARKTPAKPPAKAAARAPKPITARAAPPAPPAVPVKAAKPSRPPTAGKPAKEDKPRKAKLVRDSFTIPKAEYATLEALKKRAGTLGVPTKKSEVLRAGLMALAGMDDAAFRAAVAAVPRLKTGRPVAAE